MQRVIYTDYVKFQDRIAVLSRLPYKKHVLGDHFGDYIFIDYSESGISVWTEDNTGQTMFLSEEIYCDASMLEAVKAGLDAEEVVYESA